MIDVIHFYKILSFFFPTDFWQCHEAEDTNSIAVYTFIIHLVPCPSSETPIFGWELYPPPTTFVLSENRITESNSMIMCSHWFLCGTLHGLIPSQFQMFNPPFLLNPSRCYICLYYYYYVALFIWNWMRSHLSRVKASRFPSIRKRNSFRGLVLLFLGYLCVILVIFGWVLDEELSVRDMKSQICYFRSFLLNKAL